METSLIYLDDIIVRGRNFKEQLLNLKETFRRLRNAHLQINTKICALFQEKDTFLGHVVSSAGITTDPEIVKAVRDWHRPRNKYEVRSFLVFCSYYRRFVKDFGKIASPLDVELTKKVLGSKYHENIRRKGRDHQLIYDGLGEESLMRGLSHQ